MKALRKKLQLVFLALIITVATIIGPGCKENKETKKEELDWGFVILMIRAVYYEYGVDPEGFADELRSHPVQRRLETPTTNQRTDITDKRAGAGGEEGGGEGGQC